MPPQEAQCSAQDNQKGILTFWDVMMRVTGVASSRERVGQQGHVPSTSPAVATAIMYCFTDTYTQSSSHFFSTPYPGID